MKTKYLFLSTLVLSFFLFYQNVSAQETSFQKEISLGITPLNLIEPITPTFELVGGFRFHKKYEVEAKVGLPVGQWYQSTDFLGGFDDNEYSKEGQYAEFKFGLKRAIKTTTSATGQIRPSSFIGLEYFHHLHKYSEYDDTYRRAFQKYHFESATVSRTVKGVRARLGDTEYLSDIVVLDAYIGIGIKWETIDYQTVNEVVVDNYLYDEWDLFSLCRNCDMIGTLEKIDFSIGIKLGFIF